MTTRNVDVALADSEGSVTFIQLAIMCDIANPSCGFIAAYLDELGYNRNGYVVQHVTEQYKEADYIVALNSNNECACKLFSRDKLGDAKYLAFIELAK